MTTERLARIDSLLDPDSLMTTERRAMQPDLGWDPAETVGRKITRLSYHLGAQWLDTVRDALGRQGRARHPRQKPCSSTCPPPTPPPCRPIPTPAGRVRLMDGDEPPDWALRTLGQGGYPSRHVHAVMDLGQVDMDRLGSFRGVRRREGTTMAVLLADGVRHTARSMFAAKADHPYLDDRACSWGLPKPDVFAFRARGRGRPDLVARLDVEMLLGHIRLRAALSELTGIDISERRATNSPCGRGRPLNATGAVPTCWAHCPIRSTRSP